MKAFDYSLVKDPQYFCDNRMEAHSDHVYYRDGNEMQTAVQDGTCLLSFLADELPTLGVLTDMVRVQFLYIYIG